MGMSVSVKKATNMTNIKHNNRTMGEKQMSKNTHIDFERSGENKYLVEKDLKEFYKEEFGEALEKYNDKQKRKDRKINSYYDHIKKGKKTALQQEMIFQVGDRDDFLSEENKKIANDILGEYFFDFKRRNPNLKIYNAVIHNDEASPHLHLNFVPVADGYKRGLEKQVSFDKAIKQQDPTLDKTRPFQDWREKEVEILAKKLQQRGIERKLVGTNEYKDMNDFKEKKELEKEVSKLSKEKNQLLEEKKEVISEIKTFKEPEKILEKVEDSKKIKGFGKSVLLPLENYELLKNLALSAVKVKMKFDKLVGAFQKREIEFEKLENGYVEEIDKLAGRLVFSDKKIESLEETVSDLQNRLKGHKQNEIIYKSMLKDTNRDLNITDLEKKGRLSLDSLEKGNVPANLEKAQMWESVLEENERAGTIPKNRIQGVLKGIKAHIVDKHVKESGFSVRELKDRHFKRKESERKTPPQQSRSWDRGR